jgi:spermidine synthase
METSQDDRSQSFTISAMPRVFTFALILMGVAAITGQIILMRELLVVFYGNELSAALILAVWLVWTSLGSLVSSRIADTLPRKERLFAYGLSLAACLLPLSILAVRLSRLMWGVPLGETVGFDQMVLISLTVMGPYCLTCGFLFVLGCSAHGDKAETGERSPGHVYWLEALGSGMGGILFAGLLVHLFNHIQAALLISMALLFAAFRLLSAFATKRIGCLETLRYLILSVLIGATLIMGPQWERMARQWEWQGYDLLAVTDTLYGNLAAITTGNEISFYENGLWMFTSPDPMSAEHSVHFTLLAHPEPRRILLIGGGLSSSLEEILKHPSVQQVDYVELDPRMIAFGRSVLPASSTAVLDDPRVRLIHTDGRKYVNSTQEAYDAILINLPDPKTAQLNRYYTREFFQEAEGILQPLGIISVQMTASESIIGPSLAQSLASLYRTMEEVFAHVAVVPGATARFLGTFEDQGAEVDPALLTDRIVQRGLELLHVQEYYLDFNLSPGRRAYLKGILEAVPEPKINQDLTPSCYFYDLIHWSKSHAPKLGSLLLDLERISLAWLILGPTLAAGLLAGFNALRKSMARQKSALRCSCLVMGFSEMAASVVVILSFQVFYGYLYFQMAVLITVNMLGMALGSRFMVSRMQNFSRPWRMLGLIQGGMSLYCLALLGAIALVYVAQPQVRQFWPMEMGFGLWAFGAGLLGGLHFPLAGKLYLRGKHDVGRGGGMVYGMDLAGSALGAVAAGLFLLPVVGIVHTLTLIACWNLLAVGLVLTSEK